MFTRARRRAWKYLRVDLTLYPQNGTHDALSQEVFCVKGVFVFLFFRDSSLADGTHHEFKLYIVSLRRLIIPNV